MKSNNLKIQQHFSYVFLCCFPFLLQSNNLPKFRNVIKISYIFCSNKVVLNVFLVRSFVVVKHEENEKKGRKIIYIGILEPNSQIVYL